MPIDKINEGGNMKRHYLLISLLLLIIILGCAKAGKKVLLVFSYHPKFSWVIEETIGVEDVFKDKGITIEKFYLDTKRHTDSEWMKNIADEAVKKIDEFKPDVVIVFDDNACELVAKKYIGKKLPFVFCGMNAEPDVYGFPAENITGVLERHHIKESIDLLKKLVPDIKKYAIITDASHTSKVFVNGINGMEYPIEFCESYTINDFDDWKEKVNELQTKVDAIGLFVYHTIKKKGEELSLPPEEVLKWTLKSNKLPEFAILDFTIRDGALCGVTLSGSEQGKTAAEITLVILDGEKPSDIPIKCPEKGNPIINEKRAKELNIKIPEDILDKVEIVN